MLLGQARPGRFISVRPFQLNRQTSMGTTLTAAAPKEFFEKRRFPWEVFLRTVSGCTMYMATYGSWWRTAGVRIIKVRRRTAVLGKRAFFVGGACCVAVLGTANRGSYALRIVTGATEGAGTTSSDSGSPGRLPFESCAPWKGTFLCWVQIPPNNCHIASRNANSSSVGR